MGGERFMQTFSRGLRVKMEKVSFFGVPKAIDLREYLCSSRCDDGVNKSVIKSVIFSSLLPLQIVLLYVSMNNQ
jgi:hypothetical protein